MSPVGDLIAPSQPDGPPKRRLANAVNSLYSLGYQAYETFMRQQNTAEGRRREKLQAEQLAAIQGLESASAESTREVMTKNYTRVDMTGSKGQSILRLSAAKPGAGCNIVPDSGEPTPGMFLGWNEHGQALVVTHEQAGKARGDAEALMRAAQPYSPRNVQVHPDADLEPFTAAVQERMQQNIDRYCFDADPVEALSAMTSAFQGTDVDTPDGDVRPIAEAFQEVVAGLDIPEDTELDLTGLTDDQIRGLSATRAALITDFRDATNETLQTMSDQYNQDVAAIRARHGEPTDQAARDALDTELAQAEQRHRAELESFTAESQAWQDAVAVNFRTDPARAGFDLAQRRAIRSIRSGAHARQVNAERQSQLLIQQETAKFETAKADLVAQRDASVEKLPYTDLAARTAQIVALDESLDTSLQALTAEHEAAVDRVNAATAETVEQYDVQAATEIEKIENHNPGREHHELAAAQERLNQAADGLTAETNVVLSENNDLRLQLDQQAPPVVDASQFSGDANYGVDADELNEAASQMQAEQATKAAKRGEAAELEALAPDVEAKVTSRLDALEAERAEIEEALEGLKFAPDPEQQAELEKELAELDGEVGRLETVAEQEVEALTEPLKSDAIESAAVAARLEDVEAELARATEAAERIRQAMQAPRMPVSSQPIGDNMSFSPTAGPATIEQYSQRLGPNMVSGPQVAQSFDRGPQGGQLPAAAESHPPAPPRPTGVIQNPGAGVPETRTVIREIGWNQNPGNQAGQIGM